MLANKSAHGHGRQQAAGRDARPTARACPRIRAPKPCPLAPSRAGAGDTRTAAGCSPSSSGSSSTSSSGSRRDALLAVGALVLTGGRCWVAPGRAAAAAASMPSGGGSAAAGGPALLGASQLGTDGATLGSCAGLGACVSTFDDRPPHFAAPWEYESSPQAALAALAAAVQQEGGTVVSQESGTVPGQGPGQTYGYLCAAFAGPLGSSDDVEFLVADMSDATVLLRAVGRGGAARLQRLRRRLGWEEVPVLRNRRTFLGLPLETPWDGFGPVPPVGGVDYGSLDDGLQ